ncbi:hypothetical protein LTR29_006453 [Friedmanniomyces endolithicus]|nr:hypothetical protein LTR29_006453 [Friedmanniomyces endolithicus]KAK1812323.1 hypothetical protein LTR12_013293 [Friedmanniomyces endolithicus]
MAEPSTSFAQPSSAIMTTDTLALQNLLSRLVGQLLHGCRSVACRECMCDTGRRNASPNRPLRNYTPRSARAIALALAGGALPRKHLCVHYSSATGSGTDIKTEDDTVPEGPLDPSSFEQLLCDTTSIRDICHRSAKISLRPSKLEHWKQTLSPLLQRIVIEDAIPSSLLGNEQACQIISNALRACLDTVTDGRMDVLSYADTHIRDGSAYPPVSYANSHHPAKRWNVRHQVLDSFERGQDLLSLVCEAVAMRADLETRLQLLRSRPSRTEADRARPTLLLLLERKLDLDHAAYMQAIVWLKKTFILHWNREPSISLSSTASGALTMLELLKQLAPLDLLGGASVWFKLPTIAHNLAVVDVAESWTAGSPRNQCDFDRPDGFEDSLDGTFALHMCQDQSSSLHGRRTDADTRRQLLSTDFLFDTAQRALYFRMINHLKMQNAHSKAGKAAALRRRFPAHPHEHEPKDQVQHEEEHYLLLNVSRTNVLSDAYDQLWQRRSGELFRPLRVRLGESDELEVGHDLGGVQIEFFNLICKQAFAEDAGLFATNPITGLSYFRVGSLQPLHMFELIGLLIALAIYNGITLPLSFPNVFYKLLLGDHDLTLDDVTDHWPDIARSLRYVMETQGAEDGLSFSFPLEANGIRIFAHESSAWHHDLNELITIKVADTMPTTYPSADIDIEGLEWPGFKFTCPDTLVAPPSVSASDKARYISSYVNWLAVRSVEPQLRAFHRGFKRVIDAHSLSIFITPANLKAFMEGSAHLDINKLRECTRYDGYDPNSKYIASFWSVVKSWPEEKQKQLLKFVTAAERVPIGGPEHLTFVVQRARPTSLDHLPTSSTCFGTLQLPHYRSANVLDEKLSLALEYGLEGFGTG